MFSLNLGLEKMGAYKKLFNTEIENEYIEANEKVETNITSDETTNTDISINKEINDDKVPKC